MTQSYIPYNI